MDERLNSPSLIKHERALWLAVVGFLLTLILFLTVIIVRNDFRFISARSIKQPTVYQKARKFAVIYNYVLNHAVNPVELDELFQAAIDGMLAQLDDPYAEFVTDGAARDLQSRVSGHFGGIGTVIVKHPADGFWLDERERYVRIVEVHTDSPAARGGVQAGDFITEINGLSTEPMDGAEVVMHLRGPVDSPVQLTILRDSDTFTVNLKRDYIEVITVRQAMIGSVGYLKIHQFAQPTVAHVKNALIYFEAQGALGIVIDLRDNPGGSLEAVVKIADLFLTDGVIVSTRSRSNIQNQVFKASSKGLWSEHIPLVVLMNEFSASASEVMAGALQDNQRATIMGQVSYGKASVQQVYPLNRTGNELLKLTIAYYYTPLGQNIDGHGITPDIITEPLPLPVLSVEAYEAIRSLYARRIFEQFLNSSPQPTQDELSDFAQMQSAMYESLSQPLVLWHLERYLSSRTVQNEGYDLVNDSLLFKAKLYLSAAQEGSF
jgi:carboxyl-terminal processing protease